MTRATVPTQGTLCTSDGEAIPLQETAVDVRIDGPLARVVVRQTFISPRSAPIEAIYAFPLPHDASVWRMELCKSLRVAIVSYRDHPPEDETYASRVVLPFTGDIAAAGVAVRTLDAQGGGDGPEAVTDGLFDLVRLGWRPDAAKLAVWFGDAPPHGVEELDGFPDGCPCGNDWFAQAESCREMGIAVYAVGCLPNLRQYYGAEQVYRTVARATRGMFLALDEASLLVTLIGGAAETALDGARIDEHVFDLVSAHATALAATDEAERSRWILDGLRRADVQSRSLEPGEKAAFRALDLADVEASLTRLRVRGRLGW